MTNLKTSNVVDIATGIAGDIIKYGARTAIIKTVVRQVMAALLIRLPFLSFGPLSYLASFLLEKLVTFIVDKSILGTNLLIADLKIDMEVSKVNKLVEKAKAVPKGNDEELKKIEEELIKASRDLITILDKPRVFS